MEHNLLLQMSQHIINTFSGMVWQIYWPLAFGLILSSLLRHILPVDSVEKHLGKTNPKSLVLVSVLGMVSSSCSYAAASLSKTLLTKKATLSNSMAFLVASTNLIMEMFIVLVSLLGWQFLWGEITGGIILIILVAILFRFYPKAQEKVLRDKLSDEDKIANKKSSCCSMKMSDMDMSSMDGAKQQGEELKTDNKQESKHQNKTLLFKKIFEKISQSSGYFQMDIAMIGKEILIGVVISSLLIALMPTNWWHDIFIGANSAMPSMVHSLLDVVIGICVAILAYVCSVGNLLLAAALWHGGISFGGVMGFILADVLTIPMTHVYRNYYGKAPARWMVFFLFLSILITGLLLDLIFGQMNWHISRETIGSLHQSGFGLNFTTVMNLIFIPLSIWYYRLGKKANANMSMDM